MKTKKISPFPILLLMKIALIIPCTAQPQVISMAKATSFVNPSPTVSTPKSSLVSASAFPVGYVAGTQQYDQKITISYQIPSVHTLEWNNLKNRSIDAVDSDLDKYWNSSHEVRTALDFLSFAQFVKASSYGPLYVNFDFRFNSVQPYRIQHYRPEIKAPSIATKTLIIRR